MLRLFILSCIFVLTACNNSDINAEHAKKENVNFTTNIDQPIIKKTEAYTTTDSIADDKIKKYKISLVSGKNQKGNYTKIKYQNTLQLIKSTHETAKLQHWERKILESKINHLKNNNAGGSLEITIIRPNNDLANFINFTITINNASNEIIFAKELPFKAAHPSRINKLAWNTLKIDIPQKIRPPFFVYVTDELTNQNFKYYIKTK